MPKRQRKGGVKKGGGLPGPGSKRSKNDTPRSERSVEAEGPDGLSSAAAETPPAPRKKRAADPQAVVPPGKRRKKEQSAGRSNKGGKKSTKDSSASPSEDKNLYRRNRDDYDVDTPENRKKLNASQQGFRRNEIQHYRTRGAERITWLVHFEDDELPKNAIFFYSCRAHLGGPFSAFSNFAISPFRYPKLHPTHIFSCVEQAYQYAKIMGQYKFAGDFELPSDVLCKANGEKMTVKRILRAILAEDSPSQIVKLGRATSYRRETHPEWWNRWWPAWEGTSPDVLTEMVFCKFYQNEGLKKLLLATGDFELFEAAQSDERCGIDKHAAEAVRTLAEKGRFPGANYLGIALERARARLREVHPTAPTTYAFWPFFRWEKAINNKRERKDIFGDESYKEAMKETQKAWDEYYTGTEFATDSTAEQIFDVFKEERFIKLQKQTTKQLPFDLSRPLGDKYISSQLEAGFNREDVQLPNADTAFARVDNSARLKLRDEWETLRGNLIQLEEQQERSPDQGLKDQIAETRTKMYSVLLEAKKDVMTQAAKAAASEAVKEDSKKERSAGNGDDDEAADPEKGGRVRKATGAAAEDVEMEVDDGAGVAGEDVEMGEGNGAEGVGKDEEIQVEAAAGGVEEDVEMEDVNGDEGTGKTSIWEKNLKGAKDFGRTERAFKGRKTAAGNFAAPRPPLIHDTAFGQVSDGVQKKKPDVGLELEDDEEEKVSLTEDDLADIEQGYKEAPKMCPTVAPSSDGAAADLKKAHFQSKVHAPPPLYNDVVRCYKWLKMSQDPVFREADPVAADELYRSVELHAKERGFEKIMEI
ncbi:hypothetical protein KC318_g514 [Hortaea werneckii]|nr:hypothetical protein KC318_g514 [Hortaea werneckii]